MTGRFVLFLFCVMQRFDLIRNEKYSVESVIRFSGPRETDIVNFAGDCTQFSCEGINGFQLQGSCQCRCGEGFKTFLILRKKCQPINIGGKFTISQAPGNTYHGRIAKVTSSQLVSGMQINYCFGTNPCEPGTSCAIDIKESLYDGKAWSLLWIYEKEVTFEIVEEKGRSIIKISDDAANKNGYSGLVLKIGLTCDINSQRITSFAIFEVTGTFQVSIRGNNPTIVAKTIKTTRTTTVTPHDGKKVTRTPDEKNVFSLPGPLPIMPNQNGTNNIQESDSKKKSMDVLIIAVILAIFLIISCVLLVYMFRRWREAKNQSNRRSTEAQFSFESTTPVFLVAGGGSQKSASGESEKLGSARAPPEIDKKRSSIRQLYASLDKFFKFSKQRKSSGSLDEGYTTDDNYDYRRFTHFPKELYDAPGSVISSNDEPDYKIPEDYVANDVVVINTTNEYLVPRISNDKVGYLTPVPHYEQVGQAIPGSDSPYYNMTKQENNAYAQVIVRDESVKKLDCPFAATGGKLLTKHTVLPDYTKTGDDTANPYDEIGRVMSTKERRNMNTVETQQHDTEKVNPYDKVGRVMSTKSKFDFTTIKSIDNKPNSESVNSYDNVGRVMSTKEKQTNVDGDECVHPYDKVGKMLDKTLQRQNEYDDKYLTMTDAASLYAEVDKSRICSQYDIPEEETEAEYDQPENIPENEDADGEEEVLYDEPHVVRKPTRKPPKPPRPDSFKIVMNRHANHDEDEIDV